jgi:hypothetical protein
MVIIGLEIKLRATFKAVAPLPDKLKELLKAACDNVFRAQERIAMMKTKIMRIDYSNLREN